mmetsp:Transcript_9082/g.26777  ORF Transcript_9082/g.26777 Transcript_9082/m.26777 type:complete len:254 (-) Transcript_9082:197-958(-)
MGHKHSRTAPCAPAVQNAFKLFEYQCPKCRAKRPIQYFYKNGIFLPQAPRVVCGECNTSVIVEPFKTVEYECPSCKKWQKARLPGRPVPLNMYNVSLVSCACGFRGEASVGRLMDIACGRCWAHKTELHDVWAEDGDEVRTYCGRCQDYQRGFARVPRKKGPEQDADLEYSCEGCHRKRPVHAEELLRTEGLASCSLCGWVGYPEVVPKGHNDRPRLQETTAKKTGDKAKKHSDRTRRHHELQPEPMGILPAA